MKEIPESVLRALLRLESKRVMRTGEDSDIFEGLTPRNAPAVRAAILAEKKEEK